jgi:hypothetical protein
MQVVMPFGRPTPAAGAPVEYAATQLARSFGIEARWSDGRQLGGLSM